jgi:predicted  nucleic acid-binding Zn-ribbon protein
MSTSQQLYWLQELDLEIESKKQTLQKLTSQLGESQELKQVRADITAAQQHQEELKKQQRSLEWEDDDLTNKLKTAEAELYSGRIRNPKELSNLQLDIGMLKGKRGQLDEKILILMDQIDSSTKKLAGLTEQFKKLEADEQEEQKQLAIDIQQIKSVLAGLEQERQALNNSLDRQISQMYYELKKNKKLAVAKATQGTCSVCRIQLPITDLQKARSGSLVQCSSCGRILYLP